MPQSARTASAGGDNAIEAEDEGETQMPHGVPAPYEPSPVEIARHHNLPHYPYRNWCPHCVARRKPNAHHRQAKPSSGRRIPMFCADYCFVKDSEDKDMATVLAGRVYPTCQVLATVCVSKGTQDAITVNRIAQFLKETGFTTCV